MTTTYEIRNEKLDGIFISFNSEHEALKWWRENVEHSATTDRRHGSVVVKTCFESENEAETARLNFLLGEEGIAKFSRECLRADYEPDQWLTFARSTIDRARKAPTDETMVIWPKKDFSCQPVNNLPTKTP